MKLHEIRERLGRLCWRFLMSMVEDLPEQDQSVESGSHATAREWEPCNGLEQRFGILCEVIGQVAGSSTPMQRKADISADASAQGKKHVCPSDIARRIIGPNSGATINNVLVVGTDGSTPLKRMKIRFGDPEHVPAFFKLLATTLKSSGFQVHVARNSALPAAEIWLTCSLNEWEKTSLSCSGLIGERAAEVILQPRASRDQQGNPTTQPQVQ